MKSELDDYSCFISGDSSVSIPRLMTSRQLALFQSLIRRIRSCSSAGNGTFTVRVSESVVSSVSPESLITELTTLSYIVIGVVEVTKRSKSVLGNVPGNAPGGNLGQARFAKVTMRSYGSPNHKDSGSTGEGLTAGAGVAV